MPTLVATCCVVSTIGRNEEIMTASTVVVVFIVLFESIYYKILVRER